MKFRGWMAPIIGPVVGALVGLWTAPPDIPINEWLLALAGIGLVAGLIVWWRDFRGSKKVESDESCKKSWLK
jgi:hypothetical protein